MPRYGYNPRTGAGQVATYGGGPVTAGLASSNLYMRPRDWQAYTPEQRAMTAARQQQRFTDDPLRSATMGHVAGPSSAGPAGPSGASRMGGNRLFGNRSAMLRSMYGAGAMQVGGSVLAGPGQTMGLGGGGRLMAAGSGAPAAYGGGSAAWAAPPGIGQGGRASASNPQSLAMSAAMVPPGYGPPQTVINPVDGGPETVHFPIEGDNGAANDPGGLPSGMNPLEWYNEPGISEEERQRRLDWLNEHPFGNQPGDQGPGGPGAPGGGPGLPGPQPDDGRIGEQPIVGGPGDAGGDIPPPGIPPALPGDGQPQPGDPGAPGLPPGANPPNPPHTPEPPNPGGAGGPSGDPPTNPPGGPGNNGGNNGGGGQPPIIIPPQPGGGVGPPVTGGGYTGGGGNNELIRALLEQYQQANAEGRAANETRYNDLINYLNMRLQRGLANLQGAGDQALADVDRDSARNAADADQDMISRGLRNSTVRQNVQRGVEDDRQANRRRIQEDVRKERLQTDAVLSGDVLSAMERRTDDYPSSSELIALALQLGQGGYYPQYSSGGGGGGGGGPFITLPGGGLVNNPGYSQQYSNPFGLNRWAPTGTRFG